jgi:hypothetical protein
MGRENFSLSCELLIREITIRVVARIFMEEDSRF